MICLVRLNFDCLAQNGTNTLISYFLKEVQGQYTSLYKCCERGGGSLPGRSLW